MNSSPHARACTESPKGYISVSPLLSHHPQMSEETSTISAQVLPAPTNQRRSSGSTDLGSFKSKRYLEPGGWHRCAAAKIRQDVAKRIIPSPRRPLLLRFRQQSAGYIQVKCGIRSHLWNLPSFKTLAILLYRQKKKKKHTSLFLVCVVPSDWKYPWGQESYKLQRD